MVLWDTRRHLNGVRKSPPGRERAATFGAWPSAPDSKTLAVAYGYARRQRRPAAGSGALGHGATRERLQETPLDVPEGGVIRMAFSPDGKTRSPRGTVGGSMAAAVWCSGTRPRGAAPPGIAVFRARGRGLEPGLQPRRHHLGCGVRRRRHAAEWCSGTLHGAGGSKKKPCSPWPGGGPMRVWPSAPTARPWPRGTAAAGGGVVLWDTTRRRRVLGKAPARDRGCCCERGLQPRWQDPGLGAHSRRRRRRRGWFSGTRRTTSGSRKNLWP